ncbi:inosine-5'-monophosphate dehydrogenase [Methanobrevibacter cuticularis]|uniref:Inosine-5'-monophosphate dehydrogenase n=1 Tax=Methanobrevibacter cuticularis TaxID=47311 RepID=A0A166CZ19_9EURY|nr:CBS domain-containing protein [Methanobrevibacter cuticularis]KZX17647.1 inosine-5'-monophosphate dehydrogenase [Methanobrevibacter cuticularis]
MQIKNLMSDTLITIDKDQNVCDGLRLMEKNRISRLPVVNTNENNEKELVGIIAEKDIATKLGSSKYGNLAPSHFHISTVMVKEIITADEAMGVPEAAKLMLEKNIGALPVVSNGELIGIITKSDFIDMCKGKAYEKILLEEIMSSELISVSSEDRLIHARRVILDSNIGRLLIDENNELAGILTSKDIARALISFRKHVPDNHKQAQIKNILVEEVMSRNVKTLSTNSSVADVAKAMLGTGYNGYPVVTEDDEVVGIVTQSDLLGLIVELEMND